MIKLSKRGRRIEVRADEPLPGMKTTIPGAYLSTGGYWTVPLSLESCVLLRQKFGGRLSVAPELVRWVRGVQTARRDMARLSRQRSAKLEVLPHVAPRLYKAMRNRPYQLVGARFVADNQPGCLIADDPGLGKTLIAMGGILEAEIPGPYLVVAPKTAADATWKREIERWLPADHRVILMPKFRYQRERKLRLSRFGPKTWLIIHPEIALTQAYIRCAECGQSTVDKGRNLRTLSCKHPKDRHCKRYLVHSYKRLFEIPWGAIVADESHESLIVRQRSKETQRRRGMALIPLRTDGTRIAVSGTPWDSKPHQLWGTLNWLDARTYSAFHRWVELYWRKGGYSGYQIGEFIKEREKMLWDSLSAVALRRTKAEVAKDLPPKIYVGTRLFPHETDSPIGVWLEMDGEQARAYEEMEKYSIARLDSGRLDAMSSLAELTRLKQLACSYGDIEEVKKRDRETGDWYLDHRYHPRMPSNKLAWILDSLEEWGFPKEPLSKVVIVSFYTGILECFSREIETHFKTKPDRPLCTAISGRTKQEDRRPIIDRFNTADGPQIMMLNVKAGGTSITIDSADRMVFISETRIPDQQKQAED
ncbi:MAG TPA: DEAD/DEAH box helicase, partial [Candidatus Paceibacterota bacterium]